MIQIIKFNNPINDNEEELLLNFDLLNIDYNKWINFIENIEIKDIKFLLYNLLNDLNCTKEFKCGRPMMTSYPRYNTLLLEYFRLLYKIQDYKLYNEFFNKLIDRHINNIIFEYENPLTNNKTKFKTKKDKVKKPLWLKSVSTDLFTNKIQYIYENTKTKEIIITDDENYLEKLKEINKTKNKKDKIISTLDTSIKGITFKF